MEKNKSYFDEFNIRSMELINFFEIEAKNICFNFYLDCIEISNENIYRFDFKLFQLYKLSFVNCVFNCSVFNSKDIILDIQNNIFIHKCIFKKDVDINDVTFRKRLDITFCVFEAKCRFNMNIFFEFCNFKDNLFNNAQFEKNQFLNDIMFYNSDFNMFNFSQSIFKGSLNVVNTNLNFTFDDLQEKIKQECENFNKYKNEQNEKSLNKFANDFRDSFRVFKNVLIKDNNLLEASNFHKYELYCKEIELNSKKSKIFSKEWIDKYQLFFYRKLCDHHTDLILNLKWLIITIGMFASMLFMIKLYKCGLSILNIFNFYGLYLSALGSFILSALALFRCIDKMKAFVSINAIAILWVICCKPKLIFGIANLIGDNSYNAFENLLITIYTLIAGLIIFSLQKTARKNTIIPN
ncbi:hypothetical protein A0Y59_01260 [Campylobacter lari]|uniref:Pentapeptide repeat-containing protein n=1 Tax=Campylobacter lari TaxID=201 RepID=A0A7U8AP27_CAMLA|nr:hypothetical protein [Campylobacter lari]